MEAQGKQVGTYGIYQDITKRMQIEDELRQAQKMEGLGQFASRVAHDFNNVLAAILALTELALKQASPRNSLRWHAQKMRQQAQHASELTRQLLAFASGQVSEPLQLNLNQTVRTAVCLLEDVIGVQIQMETDLAPDLEDIWADPSQLEQMLINLSINARDAMPGGGRLRIETRNMHFSGDDARCDVHARRGPYVLLSVSDTGMGMDAATMKRISEPFFTTKQPGTARGLGLAVVYGIVKQHHGFIETYSEPGPGTTFRIYLPAAGRANLNKKEQLESNRRVSDT